jgi:hypothetical protein
MERWDRLIVSAERRSSSLMGDLIITSRTVVGAVQAPPNDTAGTTKPDRAIKAWRIHWRGKSVQRTIWTAAIAARNSKTNPAMILIVQRRMVARQSML